MQEQPQDFEKLRQLLALKRHEVPPPGYFRDFSTRVTERLTAENAQAQRGWWHQLAALLGARPAISWSFCMAAVLVLFAATTSFESDPTGNPGRLPAIEPAYASVPDQVNPASAAFWTNLEPTRLVLEMPPATNPAPADSLFNSPFYLRAEPVNFTR